MRFKNVKLSKRQEAILALVATGHTKDEIAERLFIAPVTVASHIQMIKEEIECSRLNQMAAWWWLRKYSLTVAQALTCVAFIALIGVHDLVSDNQDMRPVRTVRVGRTSSARKTGENSYVLSV